MQDDEPGDGVHPPPVFYAVGRTTSVHGLRAMICRTDMSKKAVLFKVVTLRSNVATVSTYRGRLRLRSSGPLWATAILGSVLAILGCGADKETVEGGKSLVLLNVSYDPTRELWRDLNAAFAKAYAAETGIQVEIKQSHGASGSQARAIADGLAADVATLSIWSDTEILHQRGLLRDGWEETFPNRSLPYVSTVVFVVRKGNPHQIRDWPDLIAKPIEIITPSPKTSGNGRLSLLAAWGSVLNSGGTEEQAREFLTALYARVPVLDAGARGATVTFAQKEIGDVHIALESEAKLEVSQSKGGLELVYPPSSILHEPHIALVDKVADKNGTRSGATAYLRFLYTPEGQDIIARHHFRPTLAAAMEGHRGDFPEIKLFTVNDIVGGWPEAHAKFFADGAIFDSLWTDGRSSTKF